MAETLKHITAFDCLPFDNETATADVLQEFIQSQSKNVFWFSANYNADDDSKLADTIIVIIIGQPEGLLVKQFSTTTKLIIK